MHDVFMEKVQEHETANIWGGPNRLWPTLLKYWVGYGPPGPSCSAPYEKCCIHFIQCDWDVITDAALVATPGECEYIDLSIREA